MSRTTMKRSRLSEEQIIAIVKTQEAGMATAEFCRRHGISSTTFHEWKSNFGGLEVSEARRLRSLEEENSRLEKLLARHWQTNQAPASGACCPANPERCLLALNEGWLSTIGPGRMNSSKVRGRRPKAPARAAVLERAYKARG